MKTEVRNLSRIFGKTVAVDNISFSFEDGNIFGFIGPNGAGKTTTIRIMATLDLATSGDVFYDGVSATLYPEAVRRVVGYMPDSLPGYKDIQVWEYLDFFARSFGLRGAERTRALNDIVDFTNLGELRNKFLFALSKGMKQRVSLARALIHNPKVLIMDEPAAGLDPRARHELRTLLKILAEQKKAIFLSSHILSELQDICDGAVIIEQGKLLSAGTLNDLLSQVTGGTPPPAAAESAVPQAQADGTSGLSGAPAAPRTQAAPQGVSIILKTPRGEAEPVRLKLLEHPLTRSVDLFDDDEVHAVIAGSDAEVSRVVGTVFAAGLTVLSFNRNQMGLEELFMKITQGKVQ
ncbi:MAG: ABC transporter ATP-binding protein [Lentisphaeria bacterium]|jgi:ABC-2 type transport system ATP-binding protein|nr:ABC transporter ATP-binding protein [Lentisphaeria bacterium]